MCYVLSYILKFVDIKKLISFLNFKSQHRSDLIKIDRYVRWSELDFRM